MIRAGTRVVRSAYWKQGQLDGGEGHLGTIYQPENKPTSSDKCHVVWDNGNTSVCNIGKDGELLIYDNAPTGASHPNVTCDACNKTEFLGVRWKCSTCSNYDLCNSCYMMQKHNIDHPFLRIIQNGGQRVLVGKRHGSTLLQAWGISKGAEVTRGLHWKWGNQDGGTTGLVTSIANWNKTSWRSGAKVKWKNGDVRGYRVGFDGAVDLKYVKEHGSESYYRDHLAFVEPSTQKEEKKPIAQTSTGTSDELLEGDQVTIKKVSDDLFQMMQSDYGGFSDSLAKVIGKKGEVVKVLTHKEKVYPRIKVDGQVYTINPKLLEKTKLDSDETDDFLQIISNVNDKNESTTKQTSTAPPLPPKEKPSKSSNSKVTFKAGDTVRLKWIEESRFKQLQQGFGDFVAPMLQVRCKKGKVETMILGKVARVKFDSGAMWNINPECLEPVEDDEDDGFVQKTYPSSSKPEPQRPTTPDQPFIKTNKFASGDKVRVRKIEDYQMKEMQKEYSEFDGSMKQVCGKTGTVLGVDDDTKAVTVSLAGRSWKFNPACLVLIEQGPKSKKLYGTLSSPSKGDNEPIQAGDIVRVKDLDMSALISLQEGHGGFNLSMTQTTGETGSVLKVDSDGDIQVDFPNHRPFYYNPACLQLVSRGEGTGMSPRSGTSLESDLLRLLIGHASDASLVAAASNGDLSTVDQCIRRNHSAIDIIVKDVTALMIAAGNGHKAVVERLLEAGANTEKVDKDGWTAVFFAVHGNHHTIVELLLSKSCNPNVRSNNGSTSLHLGARRSFTKCVAALLRNRNCDPNIKDNDGDTALHEAVSNKHSSVTALLVQHPRLDMNIPNKKGLPAIHLAAAHDGVVSIQKMFEKNKGIINLKKADGLTALHLAAMNDSPNSVKFFMSLSMCNKNIQDDKGSTPLHCAVAKGNNTVIEILVKGGANLNVRDNDGDTCLHMALLTRGLSSTLPPELLLLGLLAGVDGSDSNSKGVAIACFLVGNGADIKIRNKQGKTPLDLAGSTQVRNRLIQAELHKRLVGGMR